MSFYYVIHINAVMAVVIVLVDDDVFLVSFLRKASHSMGVV